MAQFTAGPQGFARSISKSNLAENLSQYSRRNSDNASDPGNSTSPPPLNLNNSISGDQASVGKASFTKPNKNIIGAGSVQGSNNSNIQGNKKVDKKKVLPTKKFPELKLMINGEYRNQNNTLSSDDDSFNVSQTNISSMNIHFISYNLLKISVTNVNWLFC